MAKKFIDQIYLYNFKKHEQFESLVEGRSFIISGANGVGKTSIFDAIRRLLGQKQEVPEPIHKGAAGADIGLYIGKDGERYLVEEKYSGRTGRGRIRFYKVTGNHKDELSPAMERLDKIIGIPIDFSCLIEAEGPKQLQHFKENLGLDLARYEHDYQGVYEQRRMVNSEIQTLKAKLNAPELRVFKADIDQYQQYKDAGELMAQKMPLDPIIQKKYQAQRHNQRLDEAGERLKRFYGELEALKERIATAEKWIDENPRIPEQPINEEYENALRHNDHIDQEIRNASEWNRQVDKVQHYVETETRLQRIEKTAKELSDELKEKQNALYGRLAELKLGEVVPGLELVNEVDPESGKVVRQGLYLDGLPFNRHQHSYGRLLKAIIQLSAFFNAGKLNFIPIPDWNLLDHEAQQDILRLAQENPDLGIQLGIEKVDESKQVITELIAV